MFMFNLSKKERIATSIMMMVSLLGAADQVSMVLPDEAPAIRAPISHEIDVAVIVGPHLLFCPVSCGSVEVDPLDIQVSVHSDGTTSNEKQDTGISIFSEVRPLSETEIASLDLPPDFENVPRVVINAVFDDGYPRCIVRIRSYPDEPDKRIVFAKVTEDGKAILVPALSIDPSIVWDPEMNNKPVDGIYPRDRIRDTEIEIPLTSGISGILPSNIDLPDSYVLAMEHSPLYGKPDKFRKWAVYDAHVIELTR